MFQENIIFLESNRSMTIDYFHPNIKNILYLSFPICQKTIKIISDTDLTYKANWWDEKLNSGETRFWVICNWHLECCAANTKSAIPDMEV